jgi:hypothetical protein
MAHWRTPMMRDWKPALQVRQDQVLLLVTSEMGDVLKARLPMAPRHRRALLTLLEGVSLWSGQPLVVAVSAADRLDWVGSGLFGDDFIPAESQLVRFQIDHLGCRARPLRGVGDFRSLRRSAT